MYVPEAFRLDDPQRIAEVMCRFDFALLVTAPKGQPQACHLPFLYVAPQGTKGRAGNGTLLAHMARANPQWQDFEKLAGAGQEALVIFQGPHSYISPNWYGVGPPSVPPSVPTWNYVAVHAYGLPRIVEDPEAVRDLLDRLVATQEEGYEPAWSTAGLSEKYMAAMQRAIVAFEIPITRLEAKAKLSQNKTAEQRAAAMTAVERAEDPLVRETGRLMREALAAGS